MQRYRPLIILGLAAFMALVTSVLVYGWLQQQRKSLQPKISKVVGLENEMVAVAATDLFWGTQLTAEMLRLVPFHPKSLPQGYASTIDGLVGRVLITNITANEPVLESKLAPIEVTKGGVAAVTQPEKRAMAIKVDDVVGVAGFIKPGNRVDVLVTIRKSTPVTKIVLQNVLVLASGPAVGRRGKEEEPYPVRVITLEVTPEEAEKLALAATQGELRLALRNYLNSKPVLTQGATVPALLNSYRPNARKAPSSKGRDAPPVPNAPPVKVQVINGDTVSTMIFKVGN